MASTVTELMRRRFGRTKEDPFAGWIKIHYNNLAAGNFSCFEYSRIAAAERSLVHLSVDGGEPFVPTSGTVTLDTTGPHNFYFFRGDSNILIPQWMWYWTASPNYIIIPESITTIQKLSLGFQSGTNFKQIFKRLTPPSNAAIVNRPTYVYADALQAYKDAWGGTISDANWHTI